MHYLLLYYIIVSEVPKCLTSLELSSKVSTLSHLKMPTRMRIIHSSSASVGVLSIMRVDFKLTLLPAVRAVTLFGHLVE